MNIEFEPHEQAALELWAARIGVTPEQVIRHMVNAATVRSAKASPEFALDLVKKLDLYDALVQSVETEAMDILNNNGGWKQ